MRTQHLSQVVVALVGTTMAMTPPGLIPANTENMTVFYSSDFLAVNGAGVSQAASINAPTLALDKNLAGVTFMVAMVDPDAPPLGLGGNGSQTFLHWMQDGLTSSPTAVTVAGKTVFPLENAAAILPIQPYQPPSPPAGVTHRYTQYLMVTTNVTGFATTAAVAQEVSTRIAFSMQDFATQANLTIISANFVNITGTPATTATNATVAARKRARHGFASME